MSKKGFRFSLQNMPSPNFTSFVVKQSMEGLPGGDLIASLQNHYWIKHKKSTERPQPSGMEEDSEEEQAAEASEPSGEDGAFEEKAGSARMEKPSQTEGTSREKKENSEKSPGFCRISYILVKEKIVGKALENSQIL